MLRGGQKSSGSSFVRILVAVFTFFGIFFLYRMIGAAPAALSGRWDSAALFLIIFFVVAGSLVYMYRWLGKPRRNTDRR